MSRHPASTELTAFIRDTLGCGCPADVFEAVDEAHTAISLAAGVGRRIDVGGRLLIYIAGQGETAPARLRLESLVTAGRAERDAHGMNRWRLVIPSDERSAEALALIEQRFAGLAGDDERLHLHLIRSSQLPKT